MASSQRYPSAWSHPDPAPLSLLKLPGEVRNKVYAEAFAEDYSQTQDRWAGSSPGQSGTNQDGYDTDHSRIRFARKFQLAQVNKQIYNEALPILYKTHIFKFGIGWCGFKPDQMKDRRLQVDSKPDMKLDKIVHLKLSIKVSALLERERPARVVPMILCTIAANCTSLRSIRIQTEEVFFYVYGVDDWQQTVNEESKASWRSLKKALPLTLQDIAEKVHRLEVEVLDDSWEDFGLAWDPMKVLEEVAPRERWVQARQKNQLDIPGVCGNSVLYSLKCPLPREAEGQAEEDVKEGSGSYHRNKYDI